jgi:molecular chaperone GrpE (heat shock protein)
VIAKRPSIAGTRLKQSWSARLSRGNEAERQAAERVAREVAEELIAKVEAQRQADKEEAARVAKELKNAHDEAERGRGEDARG